MLKHHNTFEQVDETTIKGMCPNGRFFFIDAEDFILLGNDYWNVNKFGCVYATRDGKHLTLSRVVTHAPKGLVVDHINHLPNDNRKSNLRICTSAENSRNRTAFNPYGGRRGVYKRSQYYLATFKFRKVNLRKRFDNYDDAVDQRNKWEEEYLGEFAPWDRYDEKKNRISRDVICNDLYIPKKQYWEPFFPSERVSR